jgi:hypothetical protein
VDDPLLVRRVERIRNLTRELERLGDLEAAVAR